MNKIISLPKLSQLIAAATMTDRNTAERFMLSLTAVIADGLSTDDNVKIKGLGIFSKITAGDKVKVVFVPDREIAQSINAPFAFFEPVELADSVTDEVLANAGSLAVHTDADTANMPENAGDTKNLPEESEPQTLIAEDTSMPEEEAERPAPLPPAYIQSDYIAAQSAGASTTEDAPDGTAKPMEDTFDAFTIDPQGDEDDTTTPSDSQDTAAPVVPPETETVPVVLTAAEPEAGTPADSTDVPVEPGPTDTADVNADNTAEPTEPEVIYLTEKSISWFWVIVGAIIGLLIGFAVGHFTYEPVSTFMSEYTQAHSSAGNAQAPPATLPTDTK